MHMQRLQQEMKVRAYKPDTILSLESAFLLTIRQDLHRRMRISTDNIYIIAGIDIMHRRQRDSAHNFAV